MNPKTIVNILYALLVLTGLSMLVPMMIALGYDEPDFPAYIKSMLICFIIGLPFWFLTKNNRSLKSKDGFAIVSLAWLI